jgi:protease-4
MSVATDPNVIYEARKGRRKTSFWRIIAFFALIACALAIAWGAGAFSRDGGPTTPHIARVSIAGTITDDARLLKLIEMVKDNQNVKAVILDMNTPGGTTVGGEAIYEAILKLKAEKPVVTQIGTLGASAGYMIAAATDHIVVRRSSIVGSIGVIFTYADASELLGNIGVEVKDVKTGLFKAEPAPYRTAPPEVEPALRELIDDTYQWFVDLVVENRDLTRAQVLELADGRVFSGIKSVDLKLADALGGEEASLAFLREQKDISENLEVLPWKVAAENDGLFFLRAVSTLVGFENTEWLKRLETKFAKASVDGLTSVWQVGTQ